MKGQKTLVLLGLAVFGQQAIADSQITNEQRVDLGSVELSMGVGLLSGQAREKVYDTDNGEKISQLDWDIKQVPTLHLGLTVHPLQWLSLDLLGWTLVGKGDGHMKDYDCIAMSMPTGVITPITPIPASKRPGRLNLRPLRGRSSGTMLRSGSWQAISAASSAGKVVAVPTPTRFKAFVTSLASLLPAARASVINSVTTHPI
jgi:hypothetical protein